MAAASYAPHRRSVVGYPARYPFAGFWPPISVHIAGPRKRAIAANQSLRLENSHDKQRSHQPVLSRRVADGGEDSPPRLK